MLDKSQGMPMQHFYFNSTKNIKNSAIISMIIAQVTSGMPKPYHCIFTNHAAVFTTVAIKSQPA